MVWFNSKKVNIENAQRELSAYFDKLAVNNWRDYIDISQQAITSLLPIGAISGMDNWQWQAGNTTNKAMNNELANVRHVVAIASGKGGVGKSTTTVNLARALCAMGAKVGILDADIYGPSIPLMLDLAGQQPDTLDGKIMEPIESIEGIKANSIGFLVANDDAAIWRGPMASKALVQLFNETRWGDLDYLLIDLPPGTGDIQLTLANQLPLSGAVIVSTPQDIALIDAKKAFKMFEKVNVQILGVVENMSVHICPKCGHESALFGHKGAEAYAKSEQISFLGATPLQLEIRSYMDKQADILLNEQGFYVFYENIAMRLAVELAKLAQIKSATENSIPFKQL